MEELENIRATIRQNIKNLREIDRKIRAFQEHLRELEERQAKETPRE